MGMSLGMSLAMSIGRGRGMRELRKGRAKVR
jgi:hypothetical protein